MPIRIQRLYTVINPGRTPFVNEAPSILTSLHTELISLSQTRNQILKSNRYLVHLRKVMIFILAITSALVAVTEPQKKLTSKRWSKTLSSIVRMFPPASGRASLVVSQ